MKAPICPSCNRKIMNSIEVFLKGRSLYYLGVEKLGGIYFDKWKWDSDIFWFRRRRLILGFLCRHCGKPFPDLMSKQIWKYLKIKKLTNKFGKEDAY